MSGLSTPEIVAAFSDGRMTAIEARTRLDGVTYGDLMRMLIQSGLPLPRASYPDQIERRAKARAWMFPAS